MKRFLGIIVISVFLCLNIVIVSKQNPSQTDNGVRDGEYLNEDKWLTLSKNTTGPRYFVDMKGNPVQLFGISRSQSHAGDENRLFSSVSSADALFEHYSDYGCNFIRLAINIEELCGGEIRTPEQIREHITKKVDPDVQAIIRNGMYVMLDLHSYPKGETNEDYIQYARDYYMPFTLELAKYYKDEPMIAVYELWNEPYAAASSETYGDREYWISSLREYLIENVEKIREIDTHHVILVSDRNGGWGEAIEETWNGYYDKIDTVYRNTCFSVHAYTYELDDNYIYYSHWWRLIARDNNICLLFGELETEPHISTEQGMKNLFDFLSESKNEYHFSGAMWRPYADHMVYAQLWLTNGWVKDYCSPAPKPSARYVSEAEDMFGEKNENIELLYEEDLFGYETGTGISMKPALKVTDYYEGTDEIANNVVYKEGKYKLVVRACGKKGYDGDFIVGYRDVDGVVHQIARFNGKNTEGEHYYQSVEFTAEKKIVSFVYFGCEDSKKSAVIDRVYIEGTASDKETTPRTKTDYKDINKIIDLNGKSHSLKGDFSDSKRREQ